VRVLTLVLAVVVLRAEEPRAQRLYSDVPTIRKGTAHLWRDPGAVERRDLRYGIGGRRLAPRPPYTFLKADESGTTPKVLARDGAGRRWSVKFGKEVSADVFGSRMAWALGYYAEPTYYVREGAFRRAVALKGLEDYIDAAGRFRHARFQLRSKSPEYLSDVGWSWTDNPFVGTRQLGGLKLLMLLLSNWDNKDIDDFVKRGSNTAIFRDGRRYLFFVNDWGAALGDTGRGPTRYLWYVTRSKWDCEDFSKETRKFVEVKDGRLDWAYRGTHTRLVTEGLTQADISWFLRYAGRLTDRQIHAALLASGASAEEAACYTAALRQRIRQLSEVVRFGRQPLRAEAVVR
jgi:hypothetical protein